METKGATGPDKSLCIDCGGKLGRSHVSVLYRRRCMACAYRLSLKPTVVDACRMRRGAGDRRETCQDYSRCLTEWCRMGRGDAHCPEGCRYYRDDAVRADACRADTAVGVDWAQYPGMW